MISLRNDHIAVEMAPDFGARITSLTDLATGRQWLVPGSHVGGETYLGDQARGWDECFPTVGTCHYPAWSGPMRDHGLLWGRPATLTQGPDACIAVWQDPRFAFARSLRLKSNALIADYHVLNSGPDPLPYLYSQHALLATTLADRIELTGITNLTAQGRVIGWPNHDGRDVSAIGPISDGFALKLYGDAGPTASAAISGPDGGLRINWSGDDLPHVGLWLDYGGWPPGAPVHQVALEPTTAPADDLAAAEAIGRARHLAPGESHRWTICMIATRPVSPARQS